MIIFKQAWLPLIKLWFINITWTFLFRKTTYSRPLKVNCFQKPAAFQRQLCTAQGSPEVTLLLQIASDVVFGQIPLASWLYKEWGLGFACSWTSQVPHTRFPRQAQGGEAPRGTGRRRTEQRPGGQGDERSGVLHPPLSISHSTGEHQWGMPKPTAVALGGMFQICSPRSSFVW